MFHYMNKICRLTLHKLTIKAIGNCWWIIYRSKKGVYYHLFLLYHLFISKKCRQSLSEQKNTLKKKEKKQGKKSLAVNQARTDSPCAEPGESVRLFVLEWHWTDRTGQSSICLALPECSCGVGPQSRPRCSKMILPYLFYFWCLPVFC